MRSDGNWSARIRLEFRPEIEAIGLSQKPTAHWLLQFRAFDRFGFYKHAQPVSDSSARMNQDLAAKRHADARATVQGDCVPRAERIHDFGQIKQIQASRGRDEKELPVVDHTDGAAGRFAPNARVAVSLAARCDDDVTALQNEGATRQCGFVSGPGCRCDARVRANHNAVVRGDRKDAAQSSGGNVLAVDHQIPGDAEGAWMKVPTVDDRNGVRAVHQGFEGRAAASNASQRRDDFEFDPRIAQIHANDPHGDARHAPRLEGDAGGRCGQWARSGCWHHAEAQE
jgi:hypothetical protein